MTTTVNDSFEQSEKLTRNMTKIDELTKRLVHALSEKPPLRTRLESPDPELFVKAASAYFSEAMANPEKIWAHQLAFWNESVKNWSELQASFFESGGEVSEEKPKDRRFSNPLWQTHPYFRAAKAQYDVTVKAVETALQDLDQLDSKERERVEFFSKQVLDLVAPTNYLATNPDALAKFVETDGESLVHGLENLVKDVEANHGNLSTSLADQSAFEVGVNIATSKGKVVFRNDFIELIQYEATTENVQETPLIIYPPTINKFYILDLKEKNSLIKYAVDQGFTVFVVSWVNPDSSYAYAGMEHYIEEGILKASDVVREITGQKQVNAVGYCIAGTLLTITLAYLARTGDDRFHSATYFTTLTDFSEPGELEFFLDDSFLKGVKEEVNENGFLSAYYMSRAFSYMRANDLVYGPAIRAYFLGENPPAFDLLYWNGDGTNLPARKAKQYFDALYVNNKLVNDKFEFLGETLSMKEIMTQIYVIATETDHIAPWKASFKGLNNTGGKKTFVLSESGHIAGIVNPASADKYGNWTNSAPMTTPDEWLESATFEKKSWWHEWSKWLKNESGKTIPARKIGSETHKPIMDAPGTYVKINAKNLK